MMAQRFCMRISMSISVDSTSDEILNQGPLALLLRRQYEFSFGINIFSFFKDVLVQIRTPVLTKVNRLKMLAMCPYRLP